VTVDPELLLRALAHAIPAGWTEGHSFTVAYEEDERRVLVEAAGGAALTVVPAPVSAAADASVRASRAALLCLLAGLPAPAGDKPAIRGDLHAVALLTRWAQRAQVTRRAA
jgi:hypothetical protein